MYYLTQYWIIMSLITSLIIIKTERINNNSIQKWDAGEWIVWIFLSIVFPIGIIFALHSIKSTIGDFLLKERKLNRDAVVNFLLRFLAINTVFLVLCCIYYLYFIVF